MRRLLVYGVIAIVVIAAVGGFLLYRSATDAEQESTALALERFREDPPAERPARPGLPAQGVYELAVTGDETISRGVLSFDRTLPATAPLVIRHTPEGFETEARYSNQHTEQVSYALSGEGASAVSAETRIAAGAISRTQPREWDPPPLRLPLAPRVGQTWSGQHRSGELDVTISNEVLRRDAVDVAGRAVPVFVIRSGQRIEGEYSGERVEHFWYSPARGLVVRYQIESSLQGPVDLDFNVDQTLTGLIPQV